VYISEPLIILSLSSTFQEHTHTERKTWISNAISIANSGSVQGYVLEELILFALMDKLGGDGDRLDSVFRFRKSSKLGSRKVRLISLIKGTDGVMYSCPVSWTEGSSDCLGFKARSPADVLEFLADPKGKTFLFPCTHMGPDVVCFGVDEEGGIIAFLLQGKKTAKLSAETQIKAANSVAPQNFYTNTKVCLRHFIFKNADNGLILVG
jgi:hypothetical protein